MLIKRQCPEMRLDIPQSLTSRVLIWGITFCERGKFAYLQPKTHILGSDFAGFVFNYKYQFFALGTKSLLYNPESVNKWYGGCMHAELHAGLCCLVFA